jgi:NAD(P)-dependent dehydrogenase (short-subunit alcohol dehydrogenase family)
MSDAARTAVIVGASRGIGLEFARQLAARGDRVVAGCRDPVAAAAALAALGGDVAAAHIDLRDETSCEAFAAEAARLAGGHVDLLICSAGVASDELAVNIFESAANVLGGVTQAALLAAFRVNAAGPVLVAQALRRAGALGGARPSLVANVTSTAGSMEHCGEVGSFYAYRASKAALNVMTRALAVDLQRENAAATLLQPGHVRTDFTGGRGEIDAAESVAGMLLVLARPAAELNGAWFDYKGAPVAW